MSENLHLGWEQNRRGDIWRVMKRYFVRTAYVWLTPLPNTIIQTREGSLATYVADCQFKESMQLAVPG
eukprot:scaffold321861_cov15-Prasinocladus_malaysianus.AAC.1